MVSSAALPAASLHGEETAAAIERLLSASATHAAQLQQLQSESDALRRDVVELRKHFNEQDSAAAHEVGPRLAPKAEAGGTAPGGHDHGAGGDEETHPLDLERGARCVEESHLVDVEHSVVGSLWEPTAPDLTALIGKLRYRSRNSFSEQTQKIQNGWVSSRDFWQLCKPLLEGTLDGRAQRKERIGTVGQWLKLNELPHEWRGPEPPLVAAVRAKQEELVKLLLQAKADPSEADDKKVHCIHIASMGGSITLCRKLVESGADVNARDPLGHTPLFFAPRSGVCKTLLELRADIRVLNAEGQSALHAAGCRGHVEVLTWLGTRAHKGIVDHRDKAGNTAHMCLRQRHLVRRPANSGAPAKSSQPPMEKTQNRSNSCCDSDAETSVVSTSVLPSPYGDHFESEPPVQRAAVEGESSQSLEVSILRATNLKHLNYSDDAPWCQCMVRHADRREAPSMCKTEALKNSLDPEWNETHVLEHWQVGEPLEFTIYDGGLIGSKTEGKVTLPSDRFYPGGFDGELAINGLDNAALHIRIRPLGCALTGASAPRSLGGAPRAGATAGEDEGAGATDVDEGAGATGANAAFCPMPIAALPKMPRQPQSNNDSATDGEGSGVAGASTSARAGARRAYGSILSEASE